MLVDGRVVRVPCLDDRLPVDRVVDEVRTPPPVDVPLGNFAVIDQPLPRADNLLLRVDKPGIHLLVRERVSGNLVSGLPALLDNLAVRTSLHREVRDRQRAPVGILRGTNGLLEQGGGETRGGVVVRQQDELRRARRVARQRRGLRGAATVCRWFDGFDVRGRERWGDGEVGTLGTLGTRPRVTSGSNQTPSPRHVPGATHDAAGQLYAAVEIMNERGTVRTKQERTTGEIAQPLQLNFTRERSQRHGVPPTA